MARNFHNEDPDGTPIKSILRKIEVNPRDARYIYRYIKNRRCVCVYGWHDIATLSLIIGKLGQNLRSRLLSHSCFTRRIIKSHKYGTTTQASAEIKRNGEKGSKKYRKKKPGMDTYFFLSFSFFLYSKLHFTLHFMAWWCLFQYVWPACAKVLYSVLSAWTGRPFMVVVGPVTIPGLVSMHSYVLTGASVPTLPHTYASLLCFLPMCPCLPYVLSPLSPFPSFIYVSVPLIFHLCLVSFASSPISSSPRPSFPMVFRPLLPPLVTPSPHSFPLPSFPPFHPHMAFLPFS